MLEIQPGLVKHSLVSSSTCCKDQIWCVTETVNIKLRYLQHALPSQHTLQTGLICYAHMHDDCHILWFVALLSCTTHHASGNCVKSC